VRKVIPTAVNLARTDGTQVVPAAVNLAKTDGMTLLPNLHNNLRSRFDRRSLMMLGHLGYNLLLIKRSQHHGAIHLLHTMAKPHCTAQKKGAGLGMGRRMTTIDH